MHCVVAGANAAAAERKTKSGGSPAWKPRGGKEKQSVQLEAKC